MATGTFRGFVCVTIAPSIRVFLGEFAAGARQVFPMFRFVPSDNLHITLQFLGNDVERATIPILLDAIGQSVTHITPFDLCLESASAFPARGRPRVLYVRTGEGSRQLAELARSVRSGLSALGFKEDKPFQPHITLARRQRGADTAGSVNERDLWEKAFSLRRESGLCWRVSEVFLMESTLSPAGAVYSELGRVALPGRR